MHAASPHKESDDWVRTIEEGKGYQRIATSSYRKLLARMPAYAIFAVLVRYLRPGQTALEAGCGWAFASFALAERGVSVTAVDISAKLIADLDRLKTELGEPYASHVAPLAEDIFRLETMGRTFDAVISDGTYEHFLEAHDRRAILKNFRAILHKDGLCIIAVPNLHNPFFGSVVDQKMPAMHAFTAEELASELEQGGFRALETGFSFVNPGFEQWVRSRWMIAAVRTAGRVFRFLPRFLQKIFAAHLYCVAVIRLRDMKDSNGLSQ